MPKVDLQWRASLSKAEEQFLSIIEHAVFSAEYDPALKTMLRNNKKDAETMFANAPLVTLVDDLDESLQEEQKASSSGGGALADDDECGGDDDGGGAPPDNDDELGDLPETVKTEVKKTSAESSEKNDQISSFVQVCFRKIDTLVKLFIETSDSTSISDRIKDTAVNDLRKEAQPASASEKRYVLLVYDLKAAGEASSNPSTRPPPLRGNGDHLKTYLRASIDAGDSGGSEILERDMYMLFDSGRLGPPRLLRLFFCGEPLWLGQGREGGATQEREIERER